MGGAFQTSREIFDSPIWKNIVEFRLFFLIYGNAIFSEEYKVTPTLTLKRGEWLRSTRKIQEDLQYIENRQIKTYSTSVINRCIKKLEKDGRIKTRTHELGTIFEVVNYNSYQFLCNKQQIESSNHASYMQEGCTRSGERGTDDTVDNPTYTNGLEVDQSQTRNTTWNSVGTVLEQSGNNNNNVKNVNNVIPISTTTTTMKRDYANEYDETISVMDIHTKVFGTLSMTGLMSNFVRDLLKKGISERVIGEMMLEAGESSPKPNLRFLETIAERWISEGITSRTDSKQKKEAQQNAKSQGRTKGVRHRQAASNDGANKSEFAFLAKPGRS